MQMQLLHPSSSLPHRAMSVRAAATATGKSSLYEVLRVRQNASQVEIKTAYRALAKLHHPDATARLTSSSAASAAAPPSSSDGRDFIQIHEAYATLSDPDAREVYDLKLNFDSQRGWDTIGVSGNRSPGRGRFYPTRTWETDQCW